MTILNQAKKKGTDKKIETMIHKKKKERPTLKQLKIKKDLKEEDWTDRELCKEKIQMKKKNNYIIIF